MTEPLDIGARLDEIRLLKDGWLEGNGTAPARDGLDWLETAFDLHFPEEVSLPYLYPTPEGDIRAEWSNERRELSLDVQLATKHATWHALELETDDVDDRELDLADDEDWAWLVSKVRETLGGLA